MWSSTINALCTDDGTMRGEFRRLIYYGFENNQMWKSRNNCAVREYHWQSTIKGTGKQVWKTTFSEPAPHFPPRHFAWFSVDIFGIGKKVATGTANMTSQYKMQALPTLLQTIMFWIWIYLKNLYFSTTITTPSLQTTPKHVDPNFVASIAYSIWKIWPSGENVWTPRSYSLLPIKLIFKLKFVFYFCYQSSFLYNCFQL